MLYAIDVGVVVAWASRSSVLEWVNERFWALCEAGTISCVDSVFVVAGAGSAILPVNEPLVD